MGEVVVARGDLWWLETPTDKGRPVLVVSRDSANAVIQRVMVAPVTRTVRDLPTYLALGSAEGLQADCAANFDDLASVSKPYLVRRLGDLSPRSFELCSALRSMADC